MRLENGEVLLLWPLALHVLTAGYYYNSGGLHQAIDLRTNQDGSIVKPVYAAESGTVDQVQAWDGHTRTGMQSYGNMVRLRHADYNGKTLQTRYAHLSGIVVKVGQAVKEGQLIGYTGETGNVSGAHLHFEVILGGVRVNPLNWLDDDFTCANDTVRAHLGSYKSVERPAEQEDETVENELQKLCIVNPTNDIIANAKAKGLPVEISTCALIGPASNGDAMSLWQQSEAAGSPYFSSYTEV